MTSQNQTVTINKYEMNQQPLTSNNTNAQVKFLYCVTERSCDQAATRQTTTSDHYWTAAVFIHQDTADRTQERTKNVVVQIPTSIKERLNAKVDHFNQETNKSITMVHKPGSCILCHCMRHTFYFGFFAVVLFLGTTFQYGSQTAFKHSSFLPLPWKYQHCWHVPQTLGFL